MIIWKLWFWFATKYFREFGICALQAVHIKVMWISDFCSIAQKHTSQTVSCCQSVRMFVPIALPTCDQFIAKKNYSQEYWLSLRHLLFTHVTYFLEVLLWLAVMSSSVSMSTQLLTLSKPLNPRVLRTIFLLDRSPLFSHEILVLILT